MQTLPPLTFTDICILLAVSAITITILYYLTSPHFGLTNIIINRKKLRTLVLIIGTIFIVTVVINITGALIGAI